MTRPPVLGVLAESKENVAHLFFFKENAPEASAPGPAPSADPEERKILDALARCGELQPDAVVSETGLPAYRVGPLLIALEMKSLVRRSPDGSCSLRRR